MKPKWIIAIVILVALLGGGIGYVTGVIPAWRSVPDSKSKALDSPLHIEEQQDAAFGESGVEGHRNLRFQNRGNKTLAMYLVSSDCECASVSVCTAPAEWEQLDSQEVEKRAGDSTLAWQSLKRGGESFMVPAQAHGLIRVTWKAIKVGASSIGIGLRVDDEQQSIRQRFEVPVAFVAPAFLSAEDNFRANDIDLGHLKPGAEQTVKLLCYSTTRDKFTITPAPPSDDPCIHYGAPQPLSQDEVKALPKAPDGEPVRSAFRVKITVKERANGKQLDIGPFHRPIIFKTDFSADLKVSAAVKGVVEGEVGLVPLEGKDFIDLGTVVTSKLQPVTFTLRSQDPQVQLAVDAKRSVEFLKVELLDGKEGKSEGKDKTWQARVVFRSDALFRGPIPNPNLAGYTTAPDCSVVFLISRPGKPDAPPRRLLVPVRGTVRVY